MSEFKVGDYVVHPKFSNKGLYKIYEMSGSITKVQLMPNGRKSYSFESDIRHATPEEIAAGHRIDKPSNPRELETLDKPENHISPNCKVGMFEMDKCREDFQKAFPIPAHWIEFDEKTNRYYCPYVADATASAYQSQWVVWQHQQAKVEELQTLYTQQGINMLKMQKRVDVLTQTMEEVLEEMKYPTATFEEVIVCGVKVLEQALKGEGQ